MTTPNTALLEQTMLHIETHPDLFTSTWWRDDPARDFAGWASYLAGGRFISSPDNQAPIRIGTVSVWRASVVRTNTNRLMHVRDHATSALGVSEHDADELLDTVHTIAELRVLVDNIVTYGSTAGDPSPAGEPIDPLTDTGGVDLWAVNR